jgi:UDP-2,4-diacetamido-2,4,6-trideoxy-beta-L-altropyranose hydrolase
VKVLFRTDASVTIGSGHVMRCLALAHVLRQRGAEVIFIARVLPGDLCRVIEQRGYQVLRLRITEEGGSTDQVDQVQDAMHTLAAISSAVIIADWLIVDHYALDRSWEEMVADKVDQIMVIDDLANRSHECQLLVDQNLYSEIASRYDRYLPASCTRLLGPKYALLRGEFALARQASRPRPSVARDVLIFFGGSDASNQTMRVLAAMNTLGRSELSLNVVVGVSNPHRGRIEERCRELAAERSMTITFSCQIEHMATIIAAADLAIGGGGTSCWERCCLGLPTIVMAVAENQIAVAQALEEEKAIRYLGLAEHVSNATLMQAITELLDNHSARQEMSANGKRLVDGEGASRVADAIYQAIPITTGSIQLRRAAEADEHAVLSWRNEAKVRDVSFNQKTISAAEHSRWFQAAIANPARHLLIAEHNGAPLGVLRYDVTDCSADISVYLVPGKEGAGWGTAIVIAGSAWLRQHLRHVTSVSAMILEANIASKKSFIKAGFMPCDQEDTAPDQVVLQDVESPKRLAIFRLYLQPHHHITDVS